MKQPIQKNLIKIASILSILTTLPTSVALADSVYDGIWQIGYVGRDGVWKPENSYFSITIKDNTIVVADFNAMALSQNIMKGAFFGSLPNNINLIPSPSPKNPLSIRVTVDPEVIKAVNLEKAAAVSKNPFSLAAGGVFFSSWRIEFTSKDSARFYHAQEDYKNIDLLPPVSVLQKIF